MSRDKTGHFFYSWYPTIFRADTTKLSLTEDGAYRRLIDEYMLIRGALCFDDTAIARIIGCSVEFWQEQLKNRLLPYFVIKGEFLHHKFCDETIAGDNARINKSKFNGKLGGRPPKVSKIKEINLPVTKSKPITEQNNSKQNTLFNSEDKESSSLSAKPKKIDFNFALCLWENIDPQHRTEWAEAFPAVSIKDQLAKAAVWLKANPKQKKSNYERFLFNWFCKAQDSARPGSAKMTFDEIRRENNNKAREEAMKDYVQ